MDDIKFKAVPFISSEAWAELLNTVHGTENGFYKVSYMTRDELERQFPTAPKTNTDGVL